MDERDVIAERRRSYDVPDRDHVRRCTVSVLRNVQSREVPAEHIWKRRVVVDSCVSGRRPEVLVPDNPCKLVLLRALDCLVPH